MLPMVTVDDKYLQGEITLQKGLFNILDCGIRTGKTYWAANRLIDFTRDKQYNRILILVPTTILRDQIIAEYPQCCDADEFWQPGKTWGEAPNKIGIMCYQRFGFKLLKAKDMDFLKELDVICWDECDAVFDFAINAFNQARSTDFARNDITSSEVLVHIQASSSKPEYMPLILLGFWEKIIQHEDIYCIGMSATPKRVLEYYNLLTSASYKGKIDAGYRLTQDVYFTNILEHIKTLDPDNGACYWCYSPFIEPNKGIVAAANRQGFKAIEIHSRSNTEKPMDKEQLRVLESIIQDHIIPPPYNFVVVNAALREGITIDDERFSHLIVNSFRSDERIQAARMTFPYQRHIRVWVPTIPEKYRERWLTVGECRELAEEMAVADVDDNRKRTSRIMTWNKLKDVLPMAGYNVESARKRIDGKQTQCYYITGEWHDAELVDKQFEALLAAKEGLNNVQ